MKVELNTIDKLKLKRITIYNIFFSILMLLCNVFFMYLIIEFQKIEASFFYGLYIIFGFVLIFFSSKNIYGIYRDLKLNQIEEIRGDIQKKSWIWILRYFKFNFHINNQVFNVGLINYFRFKTGESIVMHIGIYSELTIVYKNTNIN